MNRGTKTSSTHHGGSFEKKNFLETACPQAQANASDGMFIVIS